MRQQSKRQMVQPEAGSSRLANDEVYNASSMMMPNPRVLWVPMFERRSFTTRGTGPSSPYEVLIDPVLMGVGPQLAGITVHALVEKATTNFPWAIKAERSYRGDAYDAFSANLLGQQTGNGQPIGTEYTTVADFGRFIRVLVEIDDTGTVEFGVMSLSLALRFHS